MAQVTFEKKACVDFDAQFLCLLKMVGEKKVKHVFLFNCTFEIQMHKLLILF